MDSVSFSCCVDTNNAAVPLGMEIWINDTCIFDQDHVTQRAAVCHDMSDHDGDHVLRFVLKNKTSAHTTVDEHGAILADTTLTVSHIQFDGIDCDYLVSVLAQYQHDFNGTGPTTMDRFYGELGCNGTVCLKFSTPIYIWLLENL